MIAARDEKIEAATSSAAATAVSHTAVIEDFECQMVDLRLINEQRLLTIKRLNGKQGGRPCLARTEAELAQCLGSTATMSKKSMKSRIIDVLGECGTASEISSSSVSLMEAIVDAGYGEAVWESEYVWGLRMGWVHDLRDDLSLAWDSNLSMNIRDKLVISYDKWTSSG